ncbi:MAG: RNA-binding transcriptional accessory protein [Saprospiraceae bacterium]|nr:RNA-binding transcriptional accessory protein [Saprospiraceae bacterium]
MEYDISAIVSRLTALPLKSVSATIKLLQEGATVPFISRYRKEVTGSLDEVQVQNIKKVLKNSEELILRKESILSAIAELGKLTPELRFAIESCFDANDLEDLYLPYKRKKKTRADVALENGLEPLAKILMAQNNQNIERIASGYITQNVPDTQSAIDGALDIIAEWISEDQFIRERIRTICRKSGLIKSTVVAKKKELATNFTDYFDFQELLQKCPSHRYLAMMRGEAEGFLKVSIIIETERAIDVIDRKYLKHGKSESEYIENAISDAYKRLIFPSIETQIKNEYKELADDEAIRVFTKNMEQLLLAPPLGEKAVLAIDPGFRTGCKVVCLDSNGNFICYETIFPHPPQNNSVAAGNTIRRLCSDHKIEAIAIGNGTASRETQDFVENIGLSSEIRIYSVSESGASIYSASDVAREEFPELDLTVRGAISIGRRLMDPMAELVKIDPKSVGVGQYQHDVHQGKLKDALDDTVSLSVNRVGVNLNTASSHLLGYVSGLGPALAKSIIKFRTDNGNFSTRDELKKVPRLGEKAFEQCAGFLRIKEGANPLDNTGVHPESYPVLKKMAKDLNVTMDKLIHESQLRKAIQINNYISDKTGLPTLTDIMKELEKPGLDVRGQVEEFHFDQNVKKVEDLYEGMILQGVVTNMTNFGAFVDVGVKQDGLVHISQITDKFIRNPAEVLHLHQHVMVKVLSIDIPRKRVNLSMILN